MELVSLTAGLVGLLVGSGSQCLGFWFGPSWFGFFCEFPVLHNFYDLPMIAALTQVSICVLLESVNAIEHERSLQRLLSVWIVKINGQVSFVGNVDVIPHS